MIHGMDAEHGPRRELGQRTSGVAVVVVVVVVFVVSRATRRVKEQRSGRPHLHARPSNHTWGDEPPKHCKTRMHNLLEPPTGRPFLVPGELLWRKRGSREGRFGELRGPKMKAGNLKNSRADGSPTL